MRTETPPPVLPFLEVVAEIGVGTYVLFASLALAAFPGDRWALALVPVAVVVFALAARRVHGFLRPQ